MEPGARSIDHEHEVWSTEDEAQSVEPRSRSAEPPGVELATSYSSRASRIALYGEHDDLPEPEQAYEGFRRKQQLIGAGIPRSGIDEEEEEDVYVAPSGNVFQGSSIGLGVWESPRKELIALVEWVWFDRIVLLLIVFNCALLALQGPSPDTDVASSILTLYFQVLFTLELVVKVGASGFIANNTAYVWDPWNVLDLTVVITGWMPYISPSSSNVSAIRSIRALRPLRSIKRMPGVKALVDTMVLSASGLANVAMLCAFIFLVFGILGMQLFEGTLRFHCFEPGAEQPVNVNAICRPSEPGMFCEAGQGNEIFQDCFSFKPLASAVYFIVLVVAGNFVLLNLIIAILLNSLAHDGEDDEDEEEDTFQDAASEPPPLNASKSSLEFAAPGALPRRSSIVRKLERNSASRSNLLALQEPVLEADGFPFLRARSRDLALCCLPRASPPRRFALWLVALPQFDSTMLTLIVCSSLAIAFEPLTEADREGTPAWTIEALGVANTFFTAAFVLEMLLKVLALGLLFPRLDPRDGRSVAQGGRAAYLRDPWNCLDACIVLSSLIALAAPGTSFIKALRMARMLRPLRLISQHSGMKLIVDALLMTLPHVASVLVICVLFLVVFGILGVQLFGGEFYACSDPDVSLQAECAGQWLPDGTSTPEERLWANPAFGNFDSLPSASLLLFEMSGLEGWPDVMFMGIDAVGVGVAPVRGHNTVAAIYFMGWVVVGAFFVLNLFIGVIVDTFNEIKKHDGDTLFMTPEQQAWTRALAMMLKASAITRASRPDSGCRQPVYDLVTHPAFEVGVMGLILANTLCMAVDSYDKGPLLSHALTLANWVFTGAFFLEAVLKLTAFGPGKYLASAWNRFDLLIVLGSLLDVGLTSTGTTLPVSPMLLRIMRLFRVARILRVIRSGEALRVLLQTLVQSLPSLSNVVVLLALMMFIFAVLGTHLFCNVTDGDFIDRHANFGSLPVALLTLFRCATGESWNGIMHDLMEGKGCAEPGGEGCATWAAVPFFTCYTLSSTFVTLNIVIAVILDSFAESDEHPDAFANVPTEDVIDSFREAWAEVDPDARSNILLSALPDLLLRTAHPLGLKGQHSVTKRADVMKLIGRLDVEAGPIEGQPGSHRIWYLDTLDALLALAYPKTRLADFNNLDSMAQRLLEVQRHKSASKSNEAASARGLAQSASAFEALQPPRGVAQLYPIQRLQQQYRTMEGRRCERHLLKAKAEANESLLDPIGGMPPRTGASTVAAEGRLVFFGGAAADGSLLRDCWELLAGSGEWRDRSQRVPDEVAARRGHAAALQRGRMLVSGGEGQRGERLLDAWEVDLTSWTWRRVRAHLAAV
ncbi:Ion transport protein-domain-containing protein, partial [Pavlovales sp. CCMP2436]